MSAISDKLRSYGLKNLSDICTNPDKNKVTIENIQVMLGVDLLNEEQVNSLSPEHIELLQRYESVISDRRMQDIDNEWTIRKYTTMFLGVVMVLGILYVMALTWLPVPESNTRFADTSLTLMAVTVVTAIMQFLMNQVNGLRNKSDDKSTTLLPPQVKSDTMTKRPIVVVETTDTSGSDTPPEPINETVSKVPKRARTASSGMRTPPPPSSL